MRKQILSTGILCLTAALFSPSVLASDSKGELEQSWERGAMQERIIQRLDLSDEQRDKLLEIRNRHLDKMHEEMKEVLTGEQLEKFLDLRESAEQRLRQGGGGDWRGDSRSGSNNRSDSGRGEFGRGESGRGEPGRDGSGRGN
ncbi:hypothetical protein HH1059_19790 [Halorhodospira halochloris]|uniref:Zinc resistance-associated protein n=1 Tax=Halorhodospira halochloris TaxID=1052 RepID=A0A0X8XBU0_HALHR|nr:hypothetical protein [Halorhodospira halochloris]MBK1652723.1 hypothetical protein [Halorhodospira halochloris]BAU58683.1 hypothetical protein HH1059_19790 [Halorhodospira halochloris]